MGVKPSGVENSKESQDGKPSFFSFRFHFHQALPWFGMSCPSPDKPIHGRPSSLQPSTLTCVFGLCPAMVSCPEVSLSQEASPQTLLISLSPSCTLLSSF